MAAMGAVTSLLAPTTILATRHRLRWTLLRLPSAVALVGFLVLHAAVVLSDRDTLDLPGLALHAALFLGAVAFWLPVLGVNRLDEGLRAGYLFLAAPSLDLPAVVTVARGDSAGGLAMIVAMAPIGITAVVLAWRWMIAEDRMAETSTRLMGPELDSAAGFRDIGQPGQ
jgi:cytochrome c oxidase assembly factor CtaG